MELDSFLSLVVPVCVGRLCLSILPPGWPGDHNRRELGATLSASWLLGNAAWLLLPWYWFWIPATVLRLALLPAGLRPRHERDRGMRPAWLVLFGVCLWSSHLGGVTFNCSLALCGGAFAILGWKTWQRRADRRARTLAALAPVAAVVSFFVAQ